jgi:hypothetical protein
MTSSLSNFVKCLTFFYWVGVLWWGYPDFINVCRKTISCSTSLAIPIDIIYLRCHVLLLSLAFTSLRISVIYLNSGHSKLVIGFDRLSRLKECSTWMKWDWIDRQQVHLTAQMAYLNLYLSCGEVVLRRGLRSAQIIFVSQLTFRGGSQKDHGRCLQASIEWDANHYKSLSSPSSVKLIPLAPDPKPVPAWQQPGVSVLHENVMLRENFADSEDTDPRRSHPGVFYIDGNSIRLSIVETFSINQRLCGMIWEGSEIHWW